MEFSVKFGATELFNIYSEQFEQANRDKWPEIHARLTEYYKDGQGSNNLFSFVKFVSLHEILKQRKPKSILDLGSGFSTLIMSDYAHENGAKVIAVDHDDFWIKRVRSFIPDDHFPDTMEFRRADRIQLADVEPPECRYDLTIDDAVDFVHVDGPLFEPGQGAVNSNVFDIVEARRPETVLVDWRLDTARAFENRYREIYDCRLTSLMSGMQLSLVAGALDMAFHYYSVFTTK